MGGHDHDAGVLPSTPAVRTLLTWVIVPLVAGTVVAMAVLWPDRPQAPPEGALGTFYRGTVTEVHEQACAPESEALGARRCGQVAVLMEEGPDQGREVPAPVPDGPGAPAVRVGDGVLMAVVSDPADPDNHRYGIADHRRGVPLVLVVALFALVVVAFGLRRGLASLAGLAACFGLLLIFVAPGILGGQPPLLVAVVGAAMVMFVIMYLVHGVSVRTSVAVLGTLGALVLTGALGALATAASHLTGFVGDDELTLVQRLPELDLRGVLLAGIIIGSLGVLDDVSISQAATVGEIARANPALSRWQLYQAGIRVGRAHVASVVNTLVLAYAGASLPLLLLIVLNTAGADAGNVLTAQPIAQEIVRSAVATVGLVAAVPLTTALAVLVCGSPGAVVTPAASPAPRHRPARHRRVDVGEALGPAGPDRPGW
jgi:uncharacterized membrane protein